MTPIEIAGRAVADEWTRIFPGSRPTEEHRIRLARAALLALAECELPDEAIEAAQASPSQFAADPMQWHIGSLRAILRSIANEGKDNG